MSKTTLSSKHIFTHLINFSGGWGNRNVMDWGLKVFCPDYKRYVKVGSLLQAPFGTFTIHDTKKLHTSVVSDQKEKKFRREKECPIWHFRSQGIIVHIDIYPQQLKKEREDGLGFLICSSPFRGQKAFAEHNEEKLSLCFATSPSSTTAGCSHFFPQALPKHKSHGWGDCPSCCALSHKKHNIQHSCEHGNFPWDPRSSQLPPQRGLPRPEVGGGGHGGATMAEGAPGTPNPLPCIAHVPAKGAQKAGTMPSTSQVQSQAPTSSYCPLCPALSFQPRLLQSDPPLRLQTHY